MRRYYGIGIVAVLLVCCAGCGQTWRHAVKDGLFTYVSGSGAGLQISTQLADLLADVLTGGLDNLLGGNR